MLAWLKGLAKLPHLDVSSKTHEASLYHFYYYYLAAFRS